MRNKLKIVCIAMSVTAASAMADSVDDLTQYIYKVATKDQKTPKLYLRPGIELNIEGQRDGKVVRVFGEDVCPDDYIAEHGLTTTGCVGLDKSTVKVSFGSQIETWVVKKDGDKVSLMRPNGVLVSQTK